LQDFPTSESGSDSVDAAYFALDGRCVTAEATEVSGRASAAEILGQRVALVADPRPARRTDSAPACRVQAMRKASASVAAARMRSCCGLIR
jgi:hypothetical protein